MPTSRRADCVGLAVGVSVLGSGVVLLVLAVASSWGSASRTWQLVHWAAGLGLAVTGIGLSFVFLFRVLEPLFVRPSVGARASAARPMPRVSWDPRRSVDPGRRGWSFKTILLAVAVVIVLLGRHASRESRDDVDDEAEAYVELVERVGPSIDLSKGPTWAFQELLAAGLLTTGQPAMGLEGGGIEFNKRIVGSFGSAKRCIHVELREDQAPVIVNVEGECTRQNLGIPEKTTSP
jgi:hypothetical protein